MEKQNPISVPDKIELFNATVGNFVIGVAKSSIGAALLGAGLFALYARPFQMMIPGVILAGLVLILIGIFDLMRSADKGVKVDFDREGFRDHRCGLALPWHVVTGVSYNPKTTQGSSAMLQLTLCPFGKSGISAATLPSVLNKWPHGRDQVSLETTSLSYNSEQLLADISRLGGVPAQNILRNPSSL